MLVVNDRLAIPLREFKFSFSRSSGPGGQNVNKVNTKVTLRWDVVRSASLPDAVKERLCEKFPRRVNRNGELIITSQRFRDQGRNVADCLSKLQRILAAAAEPPKTRKPTRRTAASRERRLRDKKRQSKIKQLRGNKNFSRED